MDDTTNNKRRKKSKKKNRSASQQAQPQPHSQADGIQPPSLSTSDSTSFVAEADLDSNHAQSPKHEVPQAPVTSSNGHCLQEEAPQVHQDVTDSHLREEIDAAHARARELEMALDSERANSHALRFLIDDLKASQASSEANFQLQIKQLTEDMVCLRVSENYQQQKVASLLEEIQGLRDKSTQVAEIKEAQEQMEVTLRTEIQQLTEENFQLRAFHEHEKEKEIIPLTEMEDLRKENFLLKEDCAKLYKEVEEMKDTIDQLLLERRQLTAKLVTMQAGMSQIEREAGIRTQRESDFAVKSTEDSKAAAFAEDSRIQAASAASMVEKLVAENSALAEKVNDQSALIDLLTRKYNFLMELQSNGHAESAQSVGDPSLTGNEILAENEEKMRSVRYENWNSEQPAITIATDCSTSTHHESLEASAESYRVEASNGEVSPSVDTNLELQQAIVSVQDNDIKPTISEIQESHNTSILVQDNEIEQFNSVEDDAINPSTLKQNNDIKPFSDAPIMGAPIRLFSFIARYVSGADLVRIDSSQ